MRTARLVLLLSGVVVLAAPGRCGQSLCEEDDHYNTFVVAESDEHGAGDVTWYMSGCFCPDPLHGGTIPEDQPCTNVSDCIRTCCTCSDNPDRTFEAAACLDDGDGRGKTCRYPETACHAAEDPVIPDSDRPLCN